MGIQEELRCFINKHKSEKGKPYTNTSIGNPKIALNILDEEYEEFLELYSSAMTSGIHLHYTEKPVDPSPMRIDIDFRFIIPEDDNKTINDEIKDKKLKRIYTNENVFKIVDTYFKILNQYIRIKEEANICYVLEKPNPSECRNKLKDGLHIIFPHIILSNNVQHFIRKKILDIASIMFENLLICNDYDNVIDKAIIDSNCWQMYGSKKPDCETYRVSSIYNYKDNETIYKPYTTSSKNELEFIKLFSMRKQIPKDYDKSVIYDEYEGEIEEYVKHVLPAQAIKQKNKLHNNIFAKSLNINKNYITDDEFILTKRLVLECLSTNRADHYDDWINLGWVLRNIDYRLLDTWIEFSKIGSAYIEGECQTLWNKMRKDHMGLGTLRWWSKQDNIIKYNEIINESITPLIDKCIGSDGAHYDVAIVVQSQYKDEFKAISKDAWYKYDKNKHRWVKTREGLNLRLILSTEICKKFMDRSIYWSNKMYQCDEAEKPVYEEKAKKCLKISLQLKNAGFKDSIMKECKSLFIDEKFEELLDSRSHLIGFDNGVYDLKMHIFRDGMPDDYIYHSTNINYIHYNSSSLEVEEIHEFFNKIFINEAVKNYVLDIISCIIDGSIAQERFYIFTGQGSNGKSRLLDFIQKTIGDYYCILPIALLTQKRAASNSAQSELERTKGRRFAVMQEPSEQDKINIGFMKELSGNDRILVRGLYKEPYEFKPQFKMILTCNELPEVPSDDGGTWRRIRVIEFLSKFCENPVKPNEFMMDLELTDKFEKWAETFMSLLIERHKKINPNCIHEPMEVRIATESYKNNNDVIGQFITDRIIINEELTEDRLNISTIYNEMRQWSYGNLPKGKKSPDRNQIKAYIEKRLGAYPTDGKGWYGIKIKEIENPLGNN